MVGEALEMSDIYLLKRGILGALRLGVLAEAAAPGTASLLDRLPWQEGWTCLDVGCGLGFVARELARRGGQVTGVDNAPEFLEAARQHGQADYHVLDVQELERLPGFYQLVSARYLLSHLADPAEAVMSMTRKLRPGGYLVLEDVDFPGHVCHPPCPALDRYLELYQECARRRGGDARLGRKLSSLLPPDMQIRHFGMVQPLHLAGVERRVPELTLSQIGSALREFGLASRGELAGLLREIRSWRRRPGVVSLAPTYQIIAQKVP